MPGNPFSSGFSSGFGSGPQSGYLVFPALAGLGWPVKRTQSWRAVKQDAISGKRTRLNLFTYPTYSYELKHNFLRSTQSLNEWQTLSDFISSVYGGTGLFAFNDVTDNAVVAQEFGVGDGSTSVFQLLRTQYSFAELVYLVNGSPTIYINGVSVPSYLYTISATGSICFKVPPAAGTTLTWTGAFYWPCRFDEDEAQFSNFYQNLWNLKALKFSTEPLDLIEAQWYNIWLVSGSPPAEFADTATEGTSDQYFFSGFTYGSFANYLPAPGYTFARASTKYITSSQGLLASIAVNAVPFNYSAAGVPLGLLMEGASTNESLYSNSFNFSDVWSIIGTGASGAQNATGPDGVSNSAWTLTAGSGAQAYLFASISLSGATFSISIWARAGTAGYAFVGFADSTGSGYQSFNSSAGTVASAWHTTPPAGAFSNARVDTYADGWYRMSAVWTGSTPVDVRFGCADADASLTIANGHAGQLWGSQVEPQNTTSSYMPATGIAGTRAADFWTRTRVAPAALTKVISGTTPATASSVDNYLWNISDGTGSNTIQLGYSHSTGHLTIACNAAGVGQPTLDLGAYALNTPFAVALAYEAGYCAASLNGNTAVTNAVSMPSGMTLERIGGALGGTGNEWWSDVAIEAEWPFATNANKLQQLATLTL
jgi:uncharacterized protein (TIGR02217 family)